MSPFVRVIGSEVLTPTDLSLTIELFVEGKVGTIRDLKFGLRVCTDGSLGLLLFKLSFSCLTVRDGLDPTSF